MARADLRRAVNDSEAATAGETVEPTSESRSRNVLHVPACAREIALAASFYGLYTLSRDLQGSASVSYANALRNASRVIGVERYLGIFHEEALQRTLIGHRVIIETANVFYGSLHMVVTVFVLVVVYRTNRVSYRHARNALAATTALALIGFAAFPTLPPRLLPSRYGFVDTLPRFGTLWSFDSGAVAKLSNQYAAMPSLHFAWALWCALSLAPILHNKSARIVVYLYPVITLTVIIATANHFILDALSGAAILAIGHVIAGRVTDRPTRRQQTPLDTR